MTKAELHQMVDRSIDRLIRQAQRS